MGERCAGTSAAGGTGTTEPPARAGLPTTWCGAGSSSSLGRPWLMYWVSPHKFEAVFPWCSSEREDLLKSLRFWNSLCYCMRRRTGPVLTPIGTGGINPRNVNHSVMKLLQLLLCICQRECLFASYLFHVCYTAFLGSKSHL